MPLSRVPAIVGGKDVVFFLPSTISGGGHPQVGGSVRRPQHRHVKIMAGGVFGSRNHRITIRGSDSIYLMMACCREYPPSSRACNTDSNVGPCARTFPE